MEGSIRIIVGHGDPSSASPIRTSLERAGFAVAAEASSAAELTGLLQGDPPDVVILDDAIGVAAAQTTAELAPDARLVVIWPAAVLPTPGAIRVDAGAIDAELGPAIASVGASVGTRALPHR